MYRKNISVLWLQNLIPAVEYTYLYLINMSQRLWSFGFQVFTINGISHLYRICQILYIDQEYWWKSKVEDMTACSSRSSLLWAGQLLCQFKMMSGHSLDILSALGRQAIVLWQCQESQFKYKSSYKILAFYR